MDYHEKYMKYKNKYLFLKQQYGGGDRSDSPYNYKPKMHEMKLSDPYYNQILNGDKVYEIRVNDEKRRNMNVGDIINITSKNDKTKNLKTVILDKIIFKNFYDAILDLDINQVLPGIKSIEDAVEIYHSFLNYNKENAKKYGVVVFHLVANNAAQIHDLFIQNPDKCPVFDLIVSRKKTVEGRKNSKTYQKYKPGDIIKFIEKKRHCFAVITKINKYHSVRSYLEVETIDKTLPECVDNIDDALNIYASWVKPDEINDLNKKEGFGFLGIHINVII